MACEAKQQVIKLYLMLQGFNYIKMRFKRLEENVWLVSACLCFLLSPSTILCILGFSAVRQHYFGNGGG